MKFKCVSCGTIIVAYRGNHKYCACCRAEIEQMATGKKSFKECARIVCDNHKQDREEEQLREVLKKNCKSLNDIVLLTKQTGKSYGHQVAVLEGREY